MARLDHDAPDIQLAGMTIRPATCEILAGTNRIVLEPQVMRVLAVFASDPGSVISRDRLVELCWDGRSVSEDAINRVISRIRKLAGETGAFDLQTRRKVGYRLVVAPPAEGTAEPAAGPRRRRWVMAAVAALLLLMIGTAAWLYASRSHSTAGPRSLAIRVAARRPEDRARAQAFTADLAQSLGRIRGLHLLTGREGGSPDLVLEGAFGAIDARPILLTLKTGKDGAIIWSGRFAGSAGALPETQRAIAASVRYVAVLLGDRDDGPTGAREPERPDVARLASEGAKEWQVASQARQHGDTMLADRHYAAASARADAALAIDPESPKALMLRYQIDRIPSYPRPGESLQRFAERRQRADAMLTRAISADPDDPAVLVAAAEDFDRASDWEAAGALLRRAVTLGPESADANTWYAYHLALFGRCGEGQRFARKAVALDPGSAWRQRAIPRLLQCAGDVAGAAQAYRRLLRAEPANRSLAYEAYLVALSGGADDLLRLAAYLRTDLWKARPPAGIAAIVDRALAAAAAKRGRPASFERTIDRDFAAALAHRKPISAGTDGDTMFALAYEYAVAGLPAKALDALVRAHDAGSTYLPWALPYGAREFPEPLRADPRYRALWRNAPAWVQLMRRRAAARAG